MTLAFLTREGAGYPEGTWRREPEVVDVRAAGGCAMQRPQARGKFLFEGGRKLWMRGVTCGHCSSSDPKLDLPQIGWLSSGLLILAGIRKGSHTRTGLLGLHTLCQ
jgi:hypothetical protein